MKDGYLFDESGYLCEGCAQEHYTQEERENDLGYRQPFEESDSPAHCHICHTYLAAPLTSDGVSYAMDRIKDWLRTPAAVRNEPSVLGGDYEGSRKVQCARDWAEDLYSNYGLDRHSRRFLELFLTFTEK